MDEAGDEGKGDDVKEQDKGAALDAELGDIRSTCNGNGEMGIEGIA